MAAGKLTTFATRPISGGPARKATKLKVAKVASPAAGVTPGKRIDMLNNIGAVSEHPKPITPNPSQMLHKAGARTAAVNPEAATSPQTTSKRRSP